LRKIGIGHGGHGDQEVIFQAGVHAHSLSIGVV
jgi:hypothetical protein